MKRWRKHHSPPIPRARPNGGSSLYIINLKPDRWPAGTPNYEQARRRNAWLADCDNGLTKFYLYANRDHSDVRPIYDLAFAERPAEELYVLAEDPYQINNVADDPAYDAIRKQLRERLMHELRQTKDPRIIGSGEKFDEYPYYGGAPAWPGQQRIDQFRVTP